MKNKNRWSYSLALILCIIAFKASIAQLPYTPLQTDSTHIFCEVNPTMAVRSSSNTALLKTLPPVIPPGSFMICGNGKFRIIYQDIINATGAGFDDATLGAARRNCVCDVINYLESVIAIPSNIGTTDPTIDIIFNVSTYTGSGPLATAAPVFPAAFYVPTPTITPGYYGGYLYDYITTGIKPNINSEEAQVNVNFGYNYTYCTPTIANCEYDFFSIMLHEITHGLGFVSFGIDNAGTLSSRFANNVFSKFDEHFLFYNNGTTLDKLFDISAFTANNGVNPALPLNAATTNRIWQSNIPLANKQNNPIISRSSYSPGTSLSHMDEWFFRGFLSPGFCPNYVMNGSINTHQFKREYTLQEVRLLQTMGYTIKSTYSNLSILNNEPPHHTGFLLTSFAFFGTGYMNTTPASNLADLTITAVNGNTITLNLSTGIVTNGNVSQTLNFTDAEGDPITVFEPHAGWKGLYNIRGCGNGGNNSNQLSINAARNIITFVPRDNFIGRAQFAFHLYDGHQRGDYVVFTVDVSKGSTFVNSPSNELTINGNFEEGTEMRTVGANEFNLVAEELDVRFNYADGKSMADGAQYCTAGWNDVFTRNSNKLCLFDFANDCFDNCTGSAGSGTLPISNLGDRYMRYYVGTGLREYFNITLSEPILPCTYQLEADINVPAGGFTGSPTINFLFHNQGFNNNVSSAAAPTLCDVSSPLTSANLNTWTHITIPFTYTSSIAAPHVQIDALNFTGQILIDNLSIRRIGSAPSLTITPSPIGLCIGQTATITASGATTYSWSTGASTNSIVVTPSASTVYTVTATSGCSVIKTIPVTVNVTPTISVNNSTICAGTTAILSATGAMTYSWNPGGLFGSSVSVSPSVTTIYTVTGSNGGCSSNKSVTVTVNSVSLTASASPTTICSGQPSTLTVSGANTYLWMPGSISYSTTAVYPNSNTTYTVAGTNTVTGCTSTKTVSVNVLSLPTVTAVSNPTLICSSQNSTLTAGGASTYTWSTGTVSFSTSVSPTVTTTYTVTGKNASGCSNTKTVTVNVIPYVPALTASSTAVALCSSGSATVTASGANTYTWNPSSSTGSTLVVTPTVATVYTVSGNYSITGCGTGTTSIVVNPVISTLCCTAATSTLGTSFASSVSATAGTYTTSTAIIYVQGVVTFTGNTSYTGYTFRMAPGASLRVYPNKTLTLTNCKLYSCSELWDGIYLLNDMNYYSGNLISTNSSFEDMYNGIVQDFNGISLNPSIPSGTLSLTGSALNKNYNSVQIKNSPGFSSGANPYLFSMVSSSITTATSTTSPGSTLKPSSTYTYAYNQITNGSTGTSAPYVNFPRSFTGIQLSNLGYINSVNIGSRNSNTLTNTFNNLDFGINGTEVYTQVYNNYFKNITGSIKSLDPSPLGNPPAQGPDEIGIAIAITQTTTANYNSCVVGANPTIPTNTNSPYPDGNLFEDCNRGVKATNNRYVTVLGNVFTTTTTSIPVSTSAGSPPMFVINPNTYYYYTGQNAVWSSALGTKADLSYNYIRNHSTGIYDSHSINPTISGTVIVQGNDIAAPLSTGYCMQAIQIDQAGGQNIPTDQAYIYNNRLINVYRGVVSNGVLSGLLIKANTINVEGVAKTLNYQATQQRTGVALTSCQYASVKGNSFTQNGSVPTTTTTALAVNGVYATNSINTKVECNSATALGRCFVFQQTCTNSSWKVNNMSNSYTGLEIRTIGVMGPQGALTFTGTANLSANTWTNITQQTNAVSSPSVNVTSKLYLLAGATTQPTLNFSQGGSAAYSTTLTGINVTTGTSYTCNSGSAQRLMNGDSNSLTNNGNSSKMAQETDTLMLYTLLATQDEDAYEIFPEEMIYINQQSVFKLLEEDSIHAVSGTSLDDFFESQQNTAIDKLTEVQQAIANYDTTNALAINTAINPSNTVEYKHQKANELVLKYMQNHAYSFSSTDISDLFSMASECIEKGYYVVQCRNLVNVLQNTVVNYTDNCEQEASASRRKKTESLSGVEGQKTNFYLYPNPNNGSMILDYDLGGYSNAKVNLYDITGKVLGSYKLYDTKGILQMNEQNLNNGIYFYSILVGEKTIKTDKIVIIK